MKIIQAQKIPKKKLSSRELADDLIAKFCFNFPQYTFAQAKKLPYKRVVQMLRVARREEARRMFELMQVVAAPKTKKGSGVKKVLEYYQDIMEGNNG